jgi:TolB-like protein
MPPPTIKFGNIEVRPGERAVVVDGALHRPGSRAFDLLLYLIANAGRGVSKDEMMAHGWPGVVVGDNNLTVQISSLRKLLGPGALVTLPGKGYQFTLVADTDDGAIAPAARADASQDMSPPDKPSIAVLPFDFFGSDAGTGNSATIDGEHLADGIAEDLITELSRFHSLFVIARNSSFTYKGRAVDVREVSRDLGVRYVVEGSVRRNGSALRITVQLVDGLQGHHVWADKFDGGMEAVFDIQDEIVRLVSQAIAFGVEQHEVLAARRRPDNLQAYQIAVLAYQQVNDAWYRSDFDMREQAMRTARRALDLDGASALAWQVVAEAHWQHLLLQPPPDRAPVLREGFAAATRLIGIDPQSTGGYICMGMLHYLADGQLPEALAAFRRANELNPNDVRGLRGLSMMELNMGDYQRGIEHALLSLRLNPRDPASMTAHTNLALGYFCLKDYARALHHADLGIANAPNTTSAHANRALALVGLGELAQARIAFARAREVGPEFIAARLGGILPLQDTEARERWLRFARMADTPATTRPALNSAPSASRS